MPTSALIAAADKSTANANLNRVIGFGGDNFSVPLSIDGTGPASHYGNPSAPPFDILSAGALQQLRLSAPSLVILTTPADCPSWDTLLQDNNLQTIAPAPKAKRQKPPPRPLPNLKSKI